MALILEGRRLGVEFRGAGEMWPKFFFMFPQGNEEEESVELKAFWEK